MQVQDSSSYYSLRLFHSTITVIPNYFGLMTLASFYKKIELFGFRRIAGTTAKGACNTMGYASYFHEYFLRGRPWIYKSITKANNRPESKGDSTNRNSRSSRLFVQDSTECAVTEEDLIQANHAHSLPGVGPDLLNNPYQSSLRSIDAYLQKHGPKARLLAGLCNVRGPFPMADEMMVSPESTHLTPRKTINVPKPMSACTIVSTFSSTSSNGRESQNQSAGKGHVTKVVSKPATTCLEPKLLKRRLSQTEPEYNATQENFNGTNHQSQQHQHHHRQGQCLQQIQNQKQTHINCVGTASTQQHDQSSTLQQLQLLHMLGQFQSQNENQAATTGITNILQLSPLLLSAFVNTNAVATPTTNLIMQQQQQHQSPLQQHTLNADDMKYGSNNVSQSFGCQPQPNVSTDIFQELARQILTNTPTQPNLSTPTAVAAFPQGYSNNIPSWSYNNNNYPPTNWNRNDSTNNNISSVSSTKMDTTVEENIHPNINEDFQHLLLRAINSGMIKGAAFSTKN